VKAVQNSQLWKDCAIIITYDENGGRWITCRPPVRADGGVLECECRGLLSRRSLATASSITANTNGLDPEVDREKV